MRLTALVLVSLMGAAALPAGAQAPDPECDPSAPQTPAATTSAPNEDPIFVITIPLPLSGGSTPQLPDQPTYGMGAIGDFAAWAAQQAGTYAGSVAPVEPGPAMTNRPAPTTPVGSGTQCIDCSSSAPGTASGTPRFR